MCSKNIPTNKIVFFLFSSFLDFCVEKKNWKINELKKNKKKRFENANRFVIYWWSENKMETQFLILILILFGPFFHTKISQTLENLLLKSEKKKTEKLLEEEEDVWYLPHLILWILFKMENLFKSEHVIWSEANNLVNNQKIA